MACSTCGGGFWHTARCPVLEMKLRTVLLLFLAVLAVVAILDRLGASLEIRLEAALGVMLLSATAWLLVRRAVRRDQDSSL